MTRVKPSFSNKVSRSQQASPANTEPGAGIAAAGVGGLYFLLIPFFLFTISGFCGLVYEVVWSRMLVVVMGNTTLATTTILASFMAGLSVGSYVWGKYGESSTTRPLRIFGCLEAGIGLFALLFPRIIQLILPLETLISQATQAGYYPQVIIRFFFCFCLLIGPTFLMGGTLAVIGRHVIGHRQHFGRNTAILYGVNTAGALFGAFATGFFLIRYLGHIDSLRFAAVLNFFVSAIALVTDMWLRKRPLENSVLIKEPKLQTKKIQTPSKAETNLVLIGLALSGFCALAYQVLWTRLLILIIDNSVYSFTIILMAFLAGIALGSLSSASVFKVVKNQIVVFALIEIAIALSCFVFPFCVHFKHKAPAESYLSFLLTTVPLGLLTPTVLMGMAFPVGAHIYQMRKGRVGESLGIVFAANTMGGVLGALAACFFFIGRLGFQKSSLLLPGINLLIGIIIIGTQLKRKNRYAVYGISVLLALLSIFLMPPDYFHRKYAELEPSSTLIYYKESLDTTATIFEQPEQTRILYLNGTPEVDTSPLSVQTFKLMGALPGLLHKNPQNALMITFGAGITAGCAAHFVNQIDCVDLAAQAPEIASYFTPDNEEIQENKKFTFHLDDARHFIQNSSQHYSIIVSDATHPRVYDSWVLFTTEFYRLVKQGLSGDGIFLQWVPLHGLDLKQYMGIVRTFSEVFEHTSIWRVGRVGHAYTLLLATPDPLTIDFRAFWKKMAQKDIRATLQEADLDNPFAVLSSFAMGEQKVKEMVAPFPATLTDDSPAHLFFSFRATFRDQYEKWPAVSYQKISAYEESVVPFLVNIGDSKEQKADIINMLRYYKSRREW